MSVLRIFLADESAGGWQVGDARAVSSWRAAANDEPQRAASSRCHVIVPATRMRTLAVTVPPTAPHKLQQVVRFALEDQLAGDVALQHVVIAAERAADVLVHVIDRSWLLEALTRLTARGFVIDRIVAESDVAPRAIDALGTWIWRADGGFLIERNGKVIVLDQSSDALPSGLLLAIDRTAPADAATAAENGALQRIVVNGPAELATRGEAWSRATGVRFVIEPEWTWMTPADAELASAPNLLTTDLHATGIARAPERPRWRRRVLWWSLGALLLHAGASAAVWASLTWRVAAVERDTAQLIRAAAPELQGDLEVGWRAHYATFRHRLGKTAPDDALPLLADAAAGLVDIAPGSLRVINFEAGQLTIDFERSAAPLIVTALPRWSASGLSVLQAESPAGLRVRLGRP